MKLSHLLFCLIYFITLNNQKSLLAHDNKELNNLDDLVMLADNIYELLLQGNSPDDIVEMFNDHTQYPYDIKKITTLIANLVSNQNSKGVILSFIENNKDAKKYYERKNFNSKIKNCYLILKIALIIIAIVVIYYLISKYFKITVPTKKPMSLNQNKENPAFTETPVSSNQDFKNQSGWSNLANYTESISAAALGPSSLSQLGLNFMRKLNEEIEKQYKHAKGLGDSLFNTSPIPQEFVTNITKIFASTNLSETEKFELFKNSGILAQLLDLQLSSKLTTQEQIQNAIDAGLVKFDKEKNVFIPCHP